MCVVANVLGLIVSELHTHLAINKAFEIMVLEALADQETA